MKQLCGHGLESSFDHSHMTLGVGVKDKLKANFFGIGKRKCDLKYIYMLVYKN
jgi:hypothetical protein